jgi:hypothetical protein
MHARALSAKCWRQTRNDQALRDPFRTTVEDLTRPALHENLLSIPGQYLDCALGVLHGGCVERVMAGDFGSQCFQVHKFGPGHDRSPTICFHHQIHRPLSSSAAIVHCAQHPLLASATILPSPTVIRCRVSLPAPTAAAPCVLLFLLTGTEIRHRGGDTPCRRFTVR